MTAIVTNLDSYLEDLETSLSFEEFPISLIVFNTSFLLTSQSQTVPTHILKSCGKSTVVAVEIAQCVGLFVFFKMALIPLVIIPLNQT